MRDLIPMLDMGASVNFYMFHGGTNFGFTNGANHTGTEYQPTITSYDYCSPLSESGDMTKTFFAVRDVISARTGKTPRAPLFDNLSAIGRVTHSAAPLSMEEVGQDFGYIMYSSTVTGPAEERPLVLEHVHDRALVFIDGKLAGIRERTRRMDDINISLAKGESKKIDIFVENSGRVNYGPKLFDKKGIFGGIRLGQQYHFGWDMTSMTMDDLSGLYYTTDTACDGKPAFLRGNLSIADTPADTFIRLDGFHRGFVVVNGFNIGRYNNDRGPQKTLYVPAPLLRKGENEIVVFETDGYDKPVVEFFDEPDLG